MEWQDISTAPKDGTVIKLKSESYTPKQPFYWKRKRWETMLPTPMGWHISWWDEELEQPTHWMPLPVAQGGDDGK